MDDHKNICPVGVYGNLYIGGSGVARGYLNNDELTKDRFAHDPFTDNPANKIYRTGDIARWLPGGDIEISGRIDDQVKIRGYRVEPGEIEYFIEQSEGVKKSVVVLKEDEKGSQVLVGYLIAADGFDEALLVDRLREKLPDYMIPSVLMKIEEFPLTPNGKIDKKRLPAPDVRHSAKEGYVAPESETEMTLVDIWQQVMGLEKIGIRDGFFELGGHSLKAVRIMIQIRKEMNVEVSLKTLFFLKNIEGIAKYIDMDRLRNNAAVENYQEIEI